MSRELRAMGSANGLSIELGRGRVSPVALRLVLVEVRKTGGALEAIVEVPGSPGIRQSFRAPLGEDPRAGFRLRAEGGLLELDAADPSGRRKFRWMRRAGGHLQVVEGDLAVGGSRSRGQVVEASCL